MGSDRPSRFVKDWAAVYRTLSLFSFDRRLPDIPIVGLVGRCWLFALDDVLSSRFPQRVSELMAHFGDDLTHVISVEDDPKLWIEEYNAVPAFAVRREFVARDYMDSLNALPNGDTSRSLVHTANVLAMAGDSGKWALWAQRDWEVGLLITTGDFLLKAADEVPYVLPDEDFEMWRGPAGWTLELTPAMLETFRANVRAISE